VVSCLRAPAAPVLFEFSADFGFGEKLSTNTLTNTLTNKLKVGPTDSTDVVYKVYVTLTY